jgi:hypothetical protein
MIWVFLFGFFVGAAATVLGIVLIGEKARRFE